MIPIIFVCTKNFHDLLGSSPSTESPLHPHLLNVPSTVVTGVGEGRDVTHSEYYWRLSVSVVVVLGVDGGT